jgi:hypothetical protein
LVVGKANAVLVGLVSCEPFSATYVYLSKLNRLIISLIGTLFHYLLHLFEMMSSPLWKAHIKCNLCSMAPHLWMWKGAVTSSSFFLVNFHNMAKLLFPKWLKASVFLGVLIGKLKEKNIKITNTMRYFSSTNVERFLNFLFYFHFVGSQIWLNHITDDLPIQQYWKF